MDEANRFYNELVLCLRSESTVGIMEWMAAHGQSLVLNYGEDNQQWECSWITGGKRFTAVRDHPTEALKDVLGSVRTEILTANAIHASS